MALLERFSALEKTKERGFWAEKNFPLNYTNVIPIESASNADSEYHFRFTPNSKHSGLWPLKLPFIHNIKELSLSVNSNGHNYVYIQQIWINALKLFFLRNGRFFCLPWIQFLKKNVFVKPQGEPFENIAKTKGYRKNVSQNIAKTKPQKPTLWFLWKFKWP